MKTEQNFEPTSSRDADHDDDWRQRIQRALKDLRSISTTVTTPSGERVVHH